ncbi:MAG: ATP-binding protein, partial [Oscillospiraceae bacterium]|nr:ATP-binding protein [Oscillospiraceae bacterium]
SNRLPRYALLEGTTNIDDVSQYALEDFELILIREVDEAYELLKSGQADALIIENVAEAFFETYSDIVMSDFLPIIFTPVSLTAQKQELSPVISVVQRVLDEGGMHHFAALYSQGYEHYQQNRFTSQLTDIELDFIKANPVIPFAAESNSYPLSFYNIYEEQWQGISHDVLREVAGLTGLEFRIINETDTSWSDLLSMLESGEALIVSELIRSSEREGRFIWPETVFLKDQTALLSKTEFPDISINEVYSARVGLGIGNAYTELFYRWFPEHNNTVLYGSMSEAFNALENGEVDLIMNTHNMLLQLTNYQEISGYKANILFDNYVKSTFGLNKDAAVLRGIIDKALESIDTEAISGQWLRKTFDYRLRLAQAQTQVAWTVGISLFLALALIFIAFLYVSEKRKTQILAEQTAAKLANAAKSEFLATMSHEIRTPMNSIIGFAELAQENSKEPQTRDYLSKITNSTEWLLNIINDILDIAKIESGKMELEFVPFHFEDVFSRCQSVILPAITEKRLDLQIHAEPLVGKRPIGDPIRLYQILINLLSNAVKFTKEGTILFTVLNKTPAHSAESDLTEKDRAAEPEKCTMYFEVADTGVGIAPAQIEKIFEPFTQADISTTRNYGGTGLGLTIVKNMVELMGGTLTAESELGQGSKFSFELSFELTETAEDFETDSAYAAIEKPHFNGLVLICDDNAMNREVVCEHLFRVGLKTLVAENGKIAVDMVTERQQKGEKPFDLIFMDIFMPVMDGLEAASKITKLNTGTPIVAMTANVMTGEIEKYKNIGMFDCLSKPFTTKQIWRILIKHFTSSKAKMPKASGTDSAEKSQTIDEKNNAGDPDDLELYKSFYPSFLKNNKGSYAELIETLVAGDIPAAHRIVHSLKGNAGMIGMTDLQKAAADVEAQFLRIINSKADNFDIPDALLSVLDTEFTKCIEIITAELEK